MGKNANRKLKKAQRARHRVPATLKQTKSLGQDFLDVDDPLPGQNYGCFSFVTSPDKSCKITGFKARGNFESEERAKAYAELLTKKNPKYHTFVGNVGYWLPFNPDPNDCQDQEFLERGLNEIMAGYEQEDAKRQLDFEQRKQELMKKAVYEGSSQGQDEAERKRETAESIDYRLKTIDAALIECRGQLSSLPDKIKELEEQMEREKAALEKAQKVKQIEEDLKREQEEELEKRLAAAGIEPNRPTTTPSTTDTTSNETEEIAKVTQTAAAARERQLAVEAETLPGDVSSMFTASSTRPVGI